MDRMNTFDEEGLRVFTKCAEYKEYMSGLHDDIKDKGKNPVPFDAMTLEDLGKKDKNYILNVVNQMGLTDNKSDIRIMYANGYGFSWSDLETVAKFNGFIKETGTKIKVQYSLPPKIEDPEKINLQNEIFLAKKNKRKVQKMLITIGEEDSEKLDKFVAENTVKGDRQGAKYCQAILIHHILSSGLEKFT